MQMNGIRFKLGSGIATAMSVPLLLAAPAHAQDPSDQSSASSSRAQEDIVVTARNKAESILQAPLAVSSFSGETLTERNINNQDDLSLQTPGFDLSSPGGVSTPRRVIRGMSRSSRAGEDTTVSTLIAGVQTEGFRSAKTGTQP